VISLPRILFPVLSAALIWDGSLRGAETVGSGTSDFISIVYDPDTDTYSSGYVVNSAVGAQDFYSAGYTGSSTIIANVEGGDIWFGHETFTRYSGSSSYYTYDNSAAGSSNEIDFHATMVGHILAGAGDGLGNYNVTAGMAPYAGLWSASIATSFSSSDIGGFSTTTASLIAPYKAFFNGIGDTKPDVINSSWGGSDPAASSAEIVALDGLARQNPTVAFVASAGNDGTGAVSAPGSGYNNIAVGSLGGASHLEPSDYSSRGAADFFNPVTGITSTGVRAAVDIAAPGESMFLAAYLGRSGGLGASSDAGIQALLSDPSPATQYFRNMDGTSFAAPIVSGGIALLKDRANLDATAGLSGAANAMDTRILKSVIMAGATRTTGWDNGQALNGDGIIVTTQALDYATGAGALDLTEAAHVYIDGTRDVSGTGGGAIAAEGWDFGNISLGAPSNDYAFADPLAGDIELTISLNWFADRAFDNGTDIGSELSFANLDLQLWMLQDGVFRTLIAESSSLYNNSEFLRVLLAEGGDYGIRVTLNGFIYDVSGTASNEDYGLAWNTEAVPEPEAAVLLVMAIGLLIAWRWKRGAGEMA